MTRRCQRCGEKRVDGHLCPEIDAPKDEQFLDVTAGVIKDERSGYFFFTPAALDRFNSSFRTDDDAVSFDREQLAAWLGQIVRHINTQHGGTYTAPLIVALFWAFVSMLMALGPWFGLGFLLLAW